MLRSRIGAGGGAGKGTAGQPPSVTAAGFGLKGPRGWVFQDVSFTAEPGSLIAIEGPSGSGRTCLLLALTGRMRATAGHAEVAGHAMPRHMAAVRRISALGPVDGVAELESALTVAEHLRERKLLQRRFGPRASRGHIDEALKAAGLDLDSLVKGSRTTVRDLERLEALRLGVALPLLSCPRVLGVDDVDHKLGEAEREQAWEMLRGIAAGGMTVIAVCSKAPEDALVVRTRPTGAEVPTDTQRDTTELDTTELDTTETGTADVTTETEEGADDAHA